MCKAFLAASNKDAGDLLSNFLFSPHFENNVQFLVFLIDASSCLAANFKSRYRFCCSFFGSDGLLRSDNNYKRKDCKRQQ